MEDFSPYCDLEDGNPTFSHDTSDHDDAPPYQLSFMKKGYVVQKILSRQIFSEDLNLHCDRDLEDSNLTLSHNTLTRADVPLHQIWLQKVKTNSGDGRNSSFVRI